MNLIDKKLTYLFGEGEFEDIGFPSVFRDNWPNVRDHFFIFFSMMVIAELNPERNKPQNK